MYWKSAMRKCNSFRCISQLTRETADFDKSHVLSHLQMRRRNIGSKHGFGQSFNPKNPKKFQSYLYSVEDMASLSSETMQTIPFDPRWPKTGSIFSITLASKQILHSDSGSPTKTRQETAGRTTSTSTVVRSWRFAFSGNYLQPADLWKWRARTMSLATSSPRTSRLSAPTPGLRSGTNRGKR